MSRRLSGEASPAELNELTDLLERHPDQEYLLTILHTYFTAHPADEEETTSTDSSFEERFSRIIGTPLPAATPALAPPAYPEPRLRKIVPRRFIRIAAAVTGIVLLSGGAFRLLQGHSSPVIPKTAGSGEVIAGQGTRTKLLLPDGTQVWLNAGSKLHYKDDFGRLSREVELEGEAYFDVVKDAQHPFIVHASDLNIRVLGTAFTVRSYPQDPTIEATLLRGLIEVYRQDNPNAPRVMLKPNEKLVFNKHLAPSTPRLDVLTRKGVAIPPDISVTMIAGNIPDSAKEETAWMYNRLVFNGDSFKELADKMERWYNVRIVFKDEALYNYRFAGAFAKESIQEAMAALQFTASFRYEINNDEIKLYAK